jgi:hypothetical protein
MRGIGSITTTSHVRNNVLEVQPQLAISMMLAALSAGVALEFIENGNS